MSLLAVVTAGLSACSENEVSDAGEPSPPAVELPAPDGPLAVGVTPLSEFYTYAYYPAHAGTGRGRMPYATSGLLQSLGLEVQPVTAHAELDADPIRDAAPRPVVVLGPGHASFIELSTSLAEQLASHGYIVVMVQADAQLENGERQDPDQPPTEPADLERVTETVRRMRMSQVEAAIDLLHDPFTAQLVGPLDVNRIAVGGHSYGGSTAFNASLVDPRIRAAIDLDGGLFEDASRIPVAVPSLVVMAELNQDLGDTPEAQLVRDTLRVLRSSEHVAMVALVGAEHYDVTDAAAIISAIPEVLPPEVSNSGPIGAAGTTHTNTIVLRFLDAALAGAPRLPSASELVVDLPFATAVF